MNRHLGLTLDCFIPEEFETFRSEQSLGLNNEITPDSPDKPHKTTSGMLLTKLTPARMLKEAVRRLLLLVAPSRHAASPPVSECDVGSLAKQPHRRE
jgi:hypothetical protein